jgi:ribonuclease HI
MFFTCSYAINIWSWLASALNLSLNFTCLDDIWKICDLNWSPQCKVVVTSAIINLFNTIWFVRNQARFCNKNIPWRYAITLIISATSLAGNATFKTSNNSIRDFMVLKNFNVTTHQPRPPLVKEVIWSPPQFNWIKCNIDGASNGNPGNSSCGGIFRKHYVFFLSCFAEPLGISTSFHAEICGALRAIEIAFHNNWSDIWLETDSSLLVLAFNKPTLVPWQLRNRWLNMQVKLKNMRFVVTHIFREGNQAADCLANHGLTLQTLGIWFDIPVFINDCYVKDLLGMPSFRYISF